MLWVFGWLSMIQVSACLCPDLPQLGDNMAAPMVKLPPNPIYASWVKTGKYTPYI